MNDALILARDIAGDAATKAANKVNPSDDELAQIDQPAEDNTWHDAPNTSTGNLKQQFKSTISKKTPIDQNDLRDAAGDATENAHPSGSRDPTDVADLASKDAQQGTNSGVDAQSGAKAGFNTLKERTKQNIPDEDKEKAKAKAQETADQAKDTARAQRDRAKNYLSSKMPPERRDQTIWRLRKMVNECQGHPDCMFASSVCYVAEP